MGATQHLACERPHIILKTAIVTRLFYLPLRFLFKIYNFGVLTFWQRFKSISFEIKKLFNKVGYNVPLFFSREMATVAEVGEKSSGSVMAFDKNVILRS